MTESALELDKPLEYEKPELTPFGSIGKLTSGGSENLAEGLFGPNGRP